METACSPEGPYRRGVVMTRVKMVAGKEKKFIDQKQPSLDGQD